MKRGELRLDKIFFKLDSNLCRCAKKMEIPLDQQCALNNIDQIPRQIQQLRDRLENLKTKRDEFIRENQAKLEQLEERSEKFLK